MKDLFYYIYYRVSKFYEDWGESNGYIGGRVVTFMSIGSIVLSIMIPVLHYLFNEKINTDIAWIVVIITSILSFFLSQKRYKELAEKYKDEKNSRLKGWLVFVYIIGSIILYFVSLALWG